MSRIEGKGRQLTLLEEKRGKIPPRPSTQDLGLGRGTSLNQDLDQKGPMELSENLSICSAERSQKGMLVKNFCEG